MNKNKKLKAMSSSFSLLSQCVAITFSLLLIMSPFIIRLSVLSHHTALAFKPSPPCENQLNNSNILTSGGKANTTSQSRATTKVSMLTYENSSYGIKLQYPSDWSFFRPSVGSNCIGPTPVVVFYTNALNPSDTSVAVDVDKSPGKNLSQYLKYLETGDWASSAIANRPSTEMTCEELLCLAGHPAVAFFLGVDPDRPDHTKIITIVNDKAYIITIVIKHELYDKFFPIVLKMIDSFTIGNVYSNVCLSCPTNLEY